ncbi:MAG TPA: S8 family serine peptidase [Levilinea sp.]|nr:S8 family serine peptidase [Levilinea sp.]
MNITRLSHITVIFLLVIGLLPARQPAAAHTALAQYVAQEINLDAPFVPGEVVVSFEAGLAARTYRARATALAGSVGATVVRQYRNLALLSFAPEADISQAVAQAAAGNGVVLAQPNYVYALPEAASNLLSAPAITPAYIAETASGERITFSWQTLAAMRTRVTTGGIVQVIPAFPQELSTGFHWGWKHTKADLVWQNTAAHAVCLLDTGVDTAHPDLSGRFLAGFDFVNNDSIPNDDHGHGTHVAGIITARVNNTADTALGVSQARIIPVKVLNAQGMGTSYSVAAGIQFCTGRSEPRVLNLSLGGMAASRLEYEALRLFVNRGRLVVAAAGNSSTSNFVFPAAWADPKVNEFGIYNVANPNNLLHHSLISVGAGRAPGDYQVWVDRDGDRQYNANELFAPEQCASGMALDAGAAGSNYGSWVNIVAPGDAIYSTTPVSYPFYLNYYHRIASRYDFMGGTSMAAGFVSGAAARVARLTVTVSGVSRQLNAREMKTRLIESGAPLDLAVDPLVGNASKGYDNITHKPDIPLYGELIDDPDPMVLAPFCWPAASGPFGARQDMSQAVYLNVAEALDRMALMVEVKDALNGLPVPGAVVRMIDANNVDRGNTVTIASTAFAIVLNIPANNTYRMRITRSGYVTGTQQFNSNVTGEAGEIVFDAYATVSLPSNVGMHFVLDWRDPYLQPGVWGSPNVDLDLYLAVPPAIVSASGSTISVRSLIGPADARDASQFDGNLEDFTYADKSGMSSYSVLDLGTMLDPARFFALYSPFAIHNFDGGKVAGLDPEGIYSSPFESISMRQGATLTTRPFYRPMYTGNYEVFITDPNSTGFDSNLKLLDRNDPVFTAPVLRYWSKGNIYAVVPLPGSCNGSATWWRPLRINNITIDASVNACGVSPY